MTLRVTNTLTGEKEPFEPRDPDSVLLYYCGLTVSDRAHLGHARTWVHVDVMHRWLDWLGYDVRHVENFTDVNEKIVARVGEDDLGDSEPAVARRFLAAILEDMRALNLKRAEVYPRVSEHVPEIIALVESLVEAGHAYESNGSVYFDVTSFEGYGKLSNQRVEEIEAQGDPDERSEKRHPADFALWKAGGVSPAAVAEHRREGTDPPDGSPEDPPEGQVWDSPWGPGRPGWHVECSAMSMAHLGETIDVHVGGRDLVFPHHENEIAQSEASTGREFVRYWLHADLFESGAEKMSTSLGNFVPVGEAVAEYGTNALRTFLLAGTYNSTQTYSEAAIEEAIERFERLDRAHERAVGALDGPDARTKAEDEALREAVVDARTDFEAAMNDDFNTREAIAALLALSTALNRHLDEREAYDYRGLREAVGTVEGFGEGVLGLVFGSGETGSDTEGEARLADELVELVLDAREREREAGEYERADALRAELEALGVTIEDTDDGSTYRF
jgi:cysteinyl-tRNA synthetase